LPILDDPISDSILKMRINYNPKIIPDGLVWENSGWILKPGVHFSDEEKYNQAKYFDFYETYVEFLINFPNGKYINQYILSPTQLNRRAVVCLITKMKSLRIVYLTKSSDRYPGN